MGGFLMSTKLLAVRVLYNQSTVSYVVFASDKIDAVVGVVGTSN